MNAPSGRTEPTGRLVLSRWARVAVVCVLVVLQVLFLGNQASASWNPYAENYSPGCFTFSGSNHCIVVAAGDSDTISVTTTWTGTRRGLTVSALCINTSNVLQVVTATGGATTVLENPASGSVTRDYSTTCNSGYIFHGVVGWESGATLTTFDPGVDAAYWIYMASPPDTGSASCASGILSDVFVWETDDGVGFFFKWTGSTNWSRWRIHKTGDLGSTYGNLDGYVTSAGVAAFWHDTDDPASTSVFAPGDDVKIRRFADSTAADPTSCWVEVEVQAVAYDWSSHWDDDSSGGPDDYGDATDPDGGSDCSAFDIVCRIRAALSWAFMPQPETLDQFSDLGNDFEDKIPFVYVIGAVEVVEWTLPSCEMPCTDHGAFNGVFTIPSLGEPGDLFYMDSMNVLDPDDSVIVDWLRDNRTYLAAFFWVLLLAPLCFWIWRRLFPVVGSGGQ